MWPRSFFAIVAMESDDDIFLTQVSREDTCTHWPDDTYCPDTSDVSEYVLSQMVDNYQKMDEVDNLDEMLMCADDLANDVSELQRAINQSTDWCEMLTLGGAKSVSMQRNPGGISEL